MFCSNCGERIIPDEANYCWQCGVPQQPGRTPQLLEDEPPAVESTWEKCEILHTHTLDDIVPSLKAYVTFVAEAEGPTGEFTAAKSSMFTLNPCFSKPDLSPEQNNREAVRALDGLVNKLLQDGWEAIGEGENWFNRQFRRRVE